MATTLTIGQIAKGDSGYPVGLLALEDAPEVLYYRGNPALLENLSRSIVVTGARASTGYGEHITMEIVAGLKDKDVTVVNGGAYGIDGMALRSALANDMKVIAWLAGGVDRFYPSGHDTLFGRVEESGLILSAEETGSSPTKWRFLQRNKFMAYTTASALVTEAGWRSGSIDLAEQAFKAENFVGAMPGPVTSASSAGCHRLIKDGVAEVVTQASDIQFRMR